MRIARSGGKRSRLSLRVCLHEGEPDLVSLYCLSAVNDPDAHRFIFPIGPSKIEHAAYREADRLMH